MGQIFQFIVLITENAHNHVIETVLGFLGAKYGSAYLQSQHTEHQERS